ncbi:MAG: CDF family Co(II)/Ni(II) efflux transporter DmeF [Deltaproteobacteria bacterium]|nr:CDF family Co(II)/Ni(II) efflux transporter DmeF [Deltaproteobacteria bacterium]
MHDMHNIREEQPERWQHEHNYLPAGLQRSERNTRWVIGLTVAMMAIEIAAGSVFNSMALLADGWHMASHASALSITAFAYFYARRHANDTRYSFGTWKVGVLGGFSSAAVLAVIAILIAWKSFGRFLDPLVITFDEAIFVACVGLVVNLVSAWMLQDQHDGDHGDHQHDHNLRAAYLHVLADALTSFFAIFALLSGKFFGWVWMDASMGIVGSVIIGRWSFGLLRDTSRILLDADVETEAVEEIRTLLEGDSDDVVADLHLWRVGPKNLAAIVSIVSHDPHPPESYKALVPERFGLAHVTVEVNRCPAEDEKVLA